jgi:hypothetical protein
MVSFFPPLKKHASIFALLTYLGHADAARIHFGITIVILRTCGLKKASLSLKFKAIITTSD